MVDNTWNRSIDANHTQNTCFWHAVSFYVTNQVGQQYVDVHTQILHYKHHEVEKVEQQLSWHHNSQEASVRTWHHNQKLWCLRSHGTTTASRLCRLWMIRAVIPARGFSFMPTSCFSILHILHGNFTMTKQNWSCLDCMSPFQLSVIDLIKFKKTSHDTSLSTLPPFS